MKVIRKKLSETEGMPINARWEVTCECFQSYDPFTDTWFDNENADPRAGVIYMLPLRTIGEIKCDAAENMTRNLEDILDQFFLFAETVQLINAILGVIAVFQPGYGLLFALVMALIAAIIEIGVAAVLFAFSDDQVWEDIKCILYCNISEDGSVTQEQLDAAQAEIVAAYPGVVSGVTFLMFAFLGHVGMTNAGSTGDETGDCVECLCEFCYYTNFATEQDANWVKTSAAGVYVSGQGWRGTGGGSTCHDGWEECKIQYTLPAIAEIHRIYASFGMQGTGGDYEIAIDGTIVQSGTVNSGGEGKTWNGIITGQVISLRVCGQAWSNIGDAGFDGAVDGGFDFGEYNC